MTVGPLAAGRRICERSGWTVTNLKLQKILYMAHMNYMGQHGGARLVNSHFEAWDYGPVEPNLYHRVKVFGDRAIQDEFPSSGSIDGTEEAAFIDEACQHLLDWKPGELVEITHWEHGAWAANYVPGARGIAIPDADILAEYVARTSQG